MFQTFCPLATQPPPCASARVRSPARSDPASGSENSWVQASSPRRVGPSSRSCWAALPNRMTAGPARSMPTVPRLRGTPASAVSSAKIACSMVDAFRPPCSTGHDNPAYPAS